MKALDSGKAGAKIRENINYMRSVKGTTLFVSHMRVRVELKPIKKEQRKDFEATRCIIDSLNRDFQAAPNAFKYESASIM